MSRKETAPSDGLTPRWLVPTALTLMCLGLLWVVVYYVTSADYPISSLGDWNILVGFGAIMVGFVMLTRWK